MSYYHNPEETTAGKNFGFLNVRKYTGTDAKLLALNGTSRYIGRIQMIIENEEMRRRIGGRMVTITEPVSYWYFTDNNEKEHIFREPADGIDSLFVIEFKRQDL